MSNPFFMVCRTTAIRRLLPTALFIDQGTHIEWLPENKAGTLTEEEITAEVTKMQAIDAGKFGADAKTGTWFVGITSVKNAYPKP